MQQQWSPKFQLLGEESSNNGNSSGSSSQPAMLVQKIRAWYREANPRTIGLCICAVLATCFLSFSWSSSSFLVQKGPAFVQDVDWRNATAQARTRHRFLERDECDAMFHPLYSEADRAMEFWREQGGITFDHVERASGIANGRLLIYDGQLYVKGFVNGLFSRAYAQIALINEAVITSPEPLPNIEFAISINDWAHGEPLPIWELSREEHVKQVWLMPDYGFYSWPEPGVGSFQEIMHKTSKKEAEQPRWSSKDARLFWKGAFWVNGLRQKLKDVTANKPWADVQDMNWADNAAANRKTIDGHCAYKFLGHVEGGSYSGRLKFIQMCRSVIVMHKLRYIQHFHHLMNSDPNSPDQNTVVTAGEEWSELEADMQNLLKNDAKAERIATNNYHFWRYWNSNAAVNCYIRRMFHKYVEVQKFTPVLGNDDASYASFDLMRNAHWEIH